MQSIFNGGPSRFRRGRSLGVQGWVKMANVHDGVNFDVTKADAPNVQEAKTPSPTLPRVLNAAQSAWYPH